MKKIKFLPYIFIVVFVLMSITACNKDKTNNDKKDITVQKANDSQELSEKAKKVCGDWAYIHDKETSIAIFNQDGTATYDGTDYTFECDDQYITLTDSDGKTQQIRYQLNDKGMYLYRTTTYTFEGDGKPDGLVGIWSCKKMNWSFEFTDTGAFMEDGYFPGKYIVDDKNSTFRLIYNDKFEDTICYYQINDDELTIDYPWQMVSTIKK